MCKCVVAQLADHVAVSIPSAETDEAVAANIVEIEETTLVLRAKSREGAIFQLAMLHAHIDDIAARVGEKSPEADYVAAKSKAAHRLLSSVIGALKVGGASEKTVLDFYGMESRGARQ